jgi:hypothetical protein
MNRADFLKLLGLGVIWYNESEGIIVPLLPDTEKEELAEGEYFKYIEERTSPAGMDFTPAYSQNPSPCDDTIIIDLGRVKNKKCQKRIT